MKLEKKATAAITLAKSEICEEVCGGIYRGMFLVGE